MKFSWHTLKKPFFVLAPMEDVTDTVFRQVIASCARPDVFFTEFTSCDALSSVGGRKSALERLQFEPKEQPVIAQIWGTRPETFYTAAREIVKMGFAGVDINMGCPEKSIVKQGACSALIKNKPLAKDIIMAVKKGAGTLPVSVKTRIGFSEIQTEEWIGFLLDLELDALTIHARTVKEESKVPAHWEEVQKVVRLTKEKKHKTVIIGNGDILSIQEGKEKAAVYGADGIMVGRGIFHNPYLFDESFAYASWTAKERLGLLKKHVELYEKTWGDTRYYPVLKKYFKIYIQGFQDASNMRIQFMETTSARQAIELADTILQTL